MCFKADIHCYNNPTSPCSNHVLGISDGIDTVGDIRWELLGYLVVAWVGAYLVVWKGLHNSSKVGEESNCTNIAAEISRLHKTSPISHMMKDRW